MKIIVHTEGLSAKICGEICENLRENFRGFEYLRKRGFEEY
jgi:hypothetical protein